MIFGGQKAAVKNTTV